MSDDIVISHYFSLTVNQHDVVAKVVLTRPKYYSESVCHLLRRKEMQYFGNLTAKYIDFASTFLV